MRVDLDANVRFSAACPASGLGEAIRKVAIEHELVSSTLTCEEARKNIAVKRRAWLADLESLLNEVREVPDAELRADIVLIDKDRHVLGAAIACSSDLLVTGDRRHFGHLYDQEVDGVTIVSIAGLFERLNAT